MLTRLEITNVALIDSAIIDFTNGLNILSGETGSGKSVILDSLNFVLGAKADKNLIRTGQKECQVIANFSLVSNKEIKDFLKELELDIDDELIISRKYTLDGKNVIRINGVPSTVSIVKKLASFLIDIHGQTEHYSLLNTTNQLKLIDSFGGQKIQDIKNLLSKIFLEYNGLRKELNMLDLDASQRAIKLDILNYQINEIESAELVIDEEEKLLDAKKKMQHQEKIAIALSGLKSALSDEGGILDILSNALRGVNGISNITEQFSNLADRVSSFYDDGIDIEGLVVDLISNIEQIEFDANYIEGRLDKIKNLKKKYGNSIAEILVFLDNAVKEKEILENFTNIFEKQLAKKQKLEKDIYKTYLELSDIRKSYASDFSNKVLTELIELSMPKAKFKVCFSDLCDISSCQFTSQNGIDDIEFLFSANLGEPLKNLSSVISGGEMSRFMLAIKAQFAKYSSVNTYIFDEIDAGISGKTASVVAEKLFNISKQKQVIAISHLPQIASIADNNILITKTEINGHTQTQVKTLSDDEKTKEISRLVGGTDESENSIKLAEELILNANKYKF